MNEYILDILYILRSVGIRKSEDLNKYEDYIGGEVHDLEERSSNTWIEPIYKKVEQALKMQRSEFSDKKKYIVSDKDEKEMLKYMCFFPSSSIIISKGFEDGFNARGSMEYYSIPKEFFTKILDNKQFLKSNVFFLIPEMIEHKNDGQMMWDIDALSGEYCMGVKSPPKNIMGDNGIFLTQNKVELLYTTFNWLYGASIDDYQKLIAKNSLLFERYRHTLTSFMDNIYSDNFDELKYELKEADVSIRIEMEKAKAEMFTKGKRAVISVGLTCIPLLPGIPHDISEKLITIMGATSIKEIYETVDTAVRGVRGAGKTNPFWLTWQWEKLTEKKSKDNGTKTLTEG